MDDTTELELARFRSQWRQEVTRRAREQQQKQPQQPSSPPIAASGPSRRRLSVHASVRTPQFTHTHNRNITSASHHDNDSGPSIPVTAGASFNGQQQDVTSPTLAPVAEKPLASAMDHFEKAIEREGQGSLGDSLTLYRKAYRMDPNVDSKYRQKYFPRVAAPAAPVQAPPTAPNSALHSSQAPPVHHLTTSSLIESFANLRILAPPIPTLSAPCAKVGKGKEKGKELGPTDATEATSPEEEPEPERGFSLLARLPHELLLHILREVSLVDIASFARMSLVCKGLAFTVATEEAIWKEACNHHRWGFPAQVWAFKCGVLGGALDDTTFSSEDEAESSDSSISVPGRPAAPPPTHTLVSRYSNSYKTMFQDRPRIRYNGIYISTCNYIRPGAFSSTSHSAAATHNPVHIVTYYRYLRFYPDGTALSLLSTHEPSEVVYHFSKSTYTSGLHSWGKNVLRGRWRIDLGDSGDVDVETECASGEKYLFKMQLSVKTAGGSGRKGGQRQNKLVWKGFLSWNRLTDDVAEFSLRNDKPFFWSRVRSFDREAM